MPFDLEQTLQQLERTPDILRGWLADLPDALARANEGDGTWSPFDVVGHLIHGEKTDWVPRARVILEHGEGRTFEPFDRFAQERDSVGKSLRGLLDECAELRRTSVEAVRQMQLAPVELDRRGTHPEFGPVTLRQLLATWATHDLSHLAQIARVLAAQYPDEVGPWKAYLRVLQK